MNNILFKYAISAFLVVLISEVAKRSDRLGGLIASLPLISLLTLVWLYAEKQPNESIANYAYYCFWYVLGSLPFFLLFPFFMPKIGFIGAMVLSTLLTVFIFVGYATVIKQFGIELL